MPSPSRFRVRSRRVVFGDHVAPAVITVADGRFEAVEEATGAGPDGDFGDWWIGPGLVDMHVHGGGGHSFQAGAISAAGAAEFHRRHGTTTLLASLVSAPVADLEAAVAQLTPLVEEGVLAGVHLEGPFLSERRCGAHDPAHLRPPDRPALLRLLQAGTAGARSGRPPVRMVTLAPELPGGVDAVRTVVAAGRVAAVGHTDATFEVTEAAIAAGASVATHLCNGMTPAHHRAPGPVVALLAAAGVAIELIVDGVHLHSGLVRNVQRAAGPRTVLITDAISAAGAADGRYDLGGQTVIVEAGEARLERNGSLAGSVLTLDAAVRNAVGCGVPVLDAFHAATVAPARAVGIDDQAGVIAPGRRADLVILDEHLHLQGVLRAGEWVLEPPGR